jgi:solute carrier family 25 (mitochondrial phosphate transporter), member 23/24/25/41
MAATMVAMTAKSKNCVLVVEKKQGWSIALPELRFPWDSRVDKGFSLSLQGSTHAHGGLFASVGLKVSTGAPAVVSSPGDKGFKIPFADHCVKYVSEAVGYQVVGTEAEPVVEEVVDGKARKKAKKRGMKLKIKIGNPHLRRLVSGAIAGAVSRTCVAPLETIRTHLMVGSNGGSMTEVFQSIMKTEGSTGLFRGNLVNVIRVAPSKAIEVNYYPCLSNTITMYKKFCCLKLLTSSPLCTFSFNIEQLVLPTSLVLATFVQPIIFLTAQELKTYAGKTHVRLV